ncbi:MAG: hypothetical protein QOE73_2098 [Verrucomicrobiota bacterium]
MISVSVGRRSAEPSNLLIGSTESRPTDLRFGAHRAPLQLGSQRLPLQQAMEAKGLGQTPTSFRRKEAEIPRSLLPAFFRREQNGARRS